MYLIFVTYLEGAESKSSPSAGGDDDAGEILGVDDELVHPFECAFEQSSVITSGREVLSSRYWREANVSGVRRAPGLESCTA